MSATLLRRLLNELLHSPVKPEFLTLFKSVATILNLSSSARMTPWFLVSGSYETNSSDLVTHLKLS